MSNNYGFYSTTLLTLLVAPSSLHAQEPQPTVWLGPPSYDSARCFRGLFENPDGWKETRSVIDVLMCADMEEQHDVAAEHPEVAQKLLGLAEECREDLGDLLTHRKGSGVREPGR